MGPDISKSHYQIFLFGINYQVKHIWSIRMTILSVTEVCIYCDGVLDYIQHILTIYWIFLPLICTLYSNIQKCRGLSFAEPVLVYSLKFIWNPQINTPTLLQSCETMHGAKKNLSHNLSCLWAGTRRCPRLLVSKRYRHQCPSCSLVSAKLSFSCFLLVVSLAPKHDAPVLSSVLTTRRLRCALWREGVRQASRR